MLLNCGAGEDSWEFPDNWEIKSVNSKENQPWIFVGRTDAEAQSFTELWPVILWPPSVMSWLIGKDPDAGKDWGQEKGATGWDGWMASLTQWIQVWANSGKWWRTGKPGVLQSIRLQRDGHNLETEQQGTSQVVQWLRFPAPNAVPWVYLVLYHLLTFCPISFSQQALWCRQGKLHYPCWAAVESKTSRR